MSSVSEWDAFAGAASVAYALALLRLRTDLSDPVHLLLFSSVLVAGLVLVVQWLSPPDLEIRLLRFRLSRAGKAVELAAAVALTALTWLVLARPAVAVALGVAVAYLWFHRESYYDDLRTEVERLAASESSERPRNA
ncbi:hypothetical protein [Halorussus aquaticus]|uniref:Uncharacterized protein n=1 Tax=Halorussus aquaticus TaxID=2953748 RepID=A0ABD5PZW7_9EURY|nr:hypothetical protein [Halorussus aquaticus]